MQQSKTRRVFVYAIAISDWSFRWSRPVTYVIRAREAVKRYRSASIITKLMSLM